MELRTQGQIHAAVPLYCEALSASRATLGDRHPHTLISINNLASLLQAQGNLAAAEPLCREALSARRESLGDRHPDTLDSIKKLVMLRCKMLATEHPLCVNASTPDGPEPTDR